tara:strand:+ start:3357 stop:3626 length:270 start_codon:yes stop_codon:yes gene_type:complete
VFFKKFVDVTFIKSYLSIKLLRVDIMLGGLFLAIGIVFIIAGLLYIQKPTFVLAFWRRWHILSSGRFAGLFGALILILGVVLLVYSFWF